MIHRPDTNKHVRGRWGAIIGLGLVASFMLAAGAPTIVAHTALRHRVLEAAMPRFKHRARCGRARLGWLAPVVFEDVRLLRDDGELLIAIEAIRSERPLWQLLWNRRRPGRLDIVNPRAELVRSHSNGDQNEQSTSTTAENESLQTSDPRANQPPPRPLPLELLVVLHNGRVAMRDAGGQLRWQLGPIRLEAGIRPAQSTVASSTPVPEIFVRQSQLADHVALSPEVCDDLLAMAAPMLAGLARAEGAFSLSINDGHVRMTQPPEGQIGGRLIIHHATLGGGSIASKIIAVFGLPASTRLVDESAVRFYWDGQRVWHENFELRIGNVALRTSGSVGTDRTLDLTAEIVLSGLGNDRPLLRRLEEQGLLRFPIRGTLDQPRLDIDALADHGIDLVRELIGAVLNERPLGGDWLERFEQSDWLERWRNQRRSGASNGRRRPLLRNRFKILDAVPPSSVEPGAPSRNGNRDPHPPDAPPPAGGGRSPQNDQGQAGPTSQEPSQQLRRRRRRGLLSTSRPPASR